MVQDSGLEIPSLRVDGGMVRNELLMQFQADILGLPVIRPEYTETTALGAAYAAGLSVGFWSNLDELSAHWREDKRWFPRMDETERAERFRILEEGRRPFEGLAGIEAALVFRLLDSC